MSNIAVIVTRIEEIISFPNLSEQYIINTLTNHDTFYFFELEPTFTTTKHLMSHNLISIKPSIAPVLYSFF